MLSEEVILQVNGKIVARIPKDYKIVEVPGKIVNIVGGNEEN